jgi:hypothetical protein
MTDSRIRLEAVRRRADAAAARAGRDPRSVRIVAVAKTFPAEAVIELACAGQDAFGENRVQEAEAKIPQVAARAGRALEWHLVGRLQRNKARRAAELFDVIHSLDRPELADALGRAADGRAVPLRVLLQIDLDAEPQKGGIPPEQAAGLLAHVERRPGLAAIGLMALPRASADPERTRCAFARLRELLARLRRGAAHPERLRELSMGMSADFEVAIEEGATLVRIGTALFGARTERGKALA